MEQIYSTPYNEEYVHGAQLNKRKLEPLTSYFSINRALEIIIPHCNGSQVNLVNAWYVEDIVRSK